MRQVGSTTDSPLAEKFADYLRAEGIACSVDQDGHSFRIWVHNDDKVAAAKEIFQQFLSNPNDEQFKDAEQRSMAVLREKLQQQRATRGRVVRMADRWDRPTAAHCPLTIGLMAVAVVVGVLTKLEPDGSPVAAKLWFSLDRSMGLIMDGEVWRLITPIFIHMGPFHLLFNLVMLRDLGFLIESRVGSFKYLMMVVAIAVLSNFCQFWFAGPAFGGLSGLVYGLFGYIWIRGRLEPYTGFDLNRQSVTIIMGWFFLCLFGIIPHVANWVHGAGLVTGMMIAAGGWLMKPFWRGR